MIMTENVRRIDKCARGGYGIIHVCVGTQSNDVKYATKCVPTNNDGTPCLGEASIMSTIVHPYLNRALSISINSKTLDIVQDLALSDLRDYRRRNPFISHSQYITWFHHIIQALHVLHTNDIIHGDIKASNILIYNNGDIRLSDFNLSMKKTWQPHSPLYTKTHRPYETWLYNIFNEKTDVWALGCTFFELLQGRNIFSVQDSLSSIDALVDWAKFGPHQESPSLSYHSQNHISFFLDTLPPSLSDLKHFSLSLLFHCPDKRPSVQQLLSSPLFSSLSISSWHYQSLSYPSKTLSDKLKSRLLKLLTPHTFSTDMLSLIYSLYSRLDSLFHLSDEHKIYGCAWISHKLITQTSFELKKSSIKIHDIFRAERLICQFLNFQLYI